MNLEVEIFVQVLVAILVAGLAGYAGVALIGAAAARLRGGAPGTSMPDAEIEALHARVSDLTQDRERIAELEERLDFAERLLARQEEPRALQDRPQGPA